MKYQFVVIAISLFLVACNINDSQSQNKILTVPVTKVIDGDTFKVKMKGNEETVRVLLIDTPETHHPKLGVQPYGQEASAFTKQWLEGKKVTLELAVDGERDKYGRVLAYVFVGKKSLEEELLRRGLARVAYVYKPNINHLKRYKDAEEQARNKKLNIWSVTGYAENNGFHPELIKVEKGKTNKGKDGFAPDKSGNCRGKIKGNISRSGEKIYHLSSDAYYSRTKAERCFNSEEEARLSGYRTVE